MAEQDHRWMIETGRLSDFTIICQGEEIHVHKTMLVGHSKGFETFFNDDLQNKDNVMVFEDDEPELMRHLLDYFYKGTTEWNVPQADLKLHVRLWVLARRLGARTVMFTVEKRMMTALESYESKIRVLGFIDTVFTDPICSMSALGYIAGEAALALFLDKQRPEAAYNVILVADKYQTLATMMLWWSYRYTSFTEDHGITAVISTGQVR
ncbi:BTB/POZ domain-containing protein [Colletotrichum fioriniae PJ7]|uniref:BTB/POZ domain-containing protein n=1 Tax=Colletotrichum fioriniae PJ7 TaxID=1445577 RepID=A0A010RA47_9PEZI|nr:BTB/POZ domain-containing protein [Colletotrichum fioriniae PJ7]